MKKTLPVLFFIALFAMHFKNAYAQPANNICTNAVTLTSSTTCSNLVVQLEQQSPSRG